MLINVTKDDIQNGWDRQTFPSSCPVAQALRRITGFNWRVGIAYCNIVSDTKRFTLPDEVGKIIGDFDQLHIIEPFSFNLEWSIPEELRYD